MLSWRAHKSLSGQWSTRKVRTRAQVSLRYHWKWKSGWEPRLGVYTVSPQLLSGFPGWRQGRKPIVIIVWRPRKGYRPPKRKSLASSWADPERRHTVHTEYRSPGPATELTVTKSASKRVDRLWIPFLPPPASHHGEHQLPPQSCEKRKQYPCLCCFLEPFHFRGDLLRGPSGAHEGSGSNWPVGEKIDLKYLKIRRNKWKV